LMNQKKDQAKEKCDGMMELFTLVNGKKENSLDGEH
jgi:hypothetical protein